MGSASRHFKHFKRYVDGVVLQRQVALQNFKKLDRVVSSATPQFYCVACRCSSSCNSKPYKDDKIVGSSLYKRYKCNMLLWENLGGRPSICSFKSGLSSASGSLCVHQRLSAFVRLLASALDLAGGIVLPPIPSDVAGGSGGPAEETREGSKFPLSLFLSLPPFLLSLSSFFRFCYSSFKFPFSGFQATLCVAASFALLGDLVSRGFSGLVFLFSLFLTICALILPIYSIPNVIYTS
ncbi:unnamed protein product [Citrullus colocynthis]|uniref:Uncharacterized protein n=1 Tax=Citrullus colocynthis TaxID=252529 RepID=A0ABP0YZ95_9ROSI